MHHAHFEIVTITKKLVLLRDLGPWDQHKTITNDAEYVVAVLEPVCSGRRLEYIDSLGNRDRLLMDAEGRFAGFAPLGIGRV